MSLAARGLDEFLQHSRELVAVNLALAGHFGVAVRDVVMSIAAFTLARGVEVIEAAPARSAASSARARVVTARSSANAG